MFICLHIIIAHIYIYTINHRSYNAPWPIVTFRLFGTTVSNVRIQKCSSFFSSSRLSAWSIACTARWCIL